MALAAALCLLPPWVACAAGVAAGAAATLLLLFDAAFLGAYASRLTPLTIGVVGVGGAGIARGVPSLVVDAMGLAGGRVRRHRGDGDQARGVPPP